MAPQVEGPVPHVPRPPSPPHAALVTPHATPSISFKNLIFPCVCPTEPCACQNAGSGYMLFGIGISLAYGKEASIIVQLGYIATWLLYLMSSNSGERKFAIDSLYLRLMIMIAVYAFCDTTFRMACVQMFQLFAHTSFAIVNPRRYAGIWTRGFRGEGLCE